MSADQSTRRRRVGWKILWSIPILGAAIGLGFAIVGLQIDDIVLATNPCAKGFDNLFTRVAQIAFLFGIGGSVAITVLAILTKNRRGLLGGSIAIVAGVLVMFMGLLLASAGYGWHCPGL